MTDVIDAFAYGIEDADGGIAVVFYDRDGLPVARLFVELAAVGDFLTEARHCADIAHRALRSWDDREALIGDGVPASYHEGTN